LLQLLRIDQEFMPNADDTTGIASSPPSREKRSRCVGLWIAAALVALLAVPTARMLGPSDIHDQTQPKTISYTTDIVIHPAHWALPRFSETRPATKPPLYNWIAAPAVALTNGTSIIAHKIPSILAYLAMAFLIWRLGTRLDRLQQNRLEVNRNDQGGFTHISGPVAVLMFAISPAIYKLCYLARPDTILMLWLVLGWFAATKVALCTRERVQAMSEDTARPGVFSWQLIMWTSAGLAGLTKGPAALAIPAFAFVFGWFLPRIEKSRTDSATKTGRFTTFLACARRSFRRFGMGWGIPLMVMMPVAWLLLAYLDDPVHTYNILIREEITDRILGIGDEGTSRGPWDWVYTFFDMPFYFLTRFLPWSVLFIGAAVDFLRKPGSRSRRPFGLPQLDESGEDEPGDSVIELRTWLVSALLWPVLIVILFTLSAGKRADYIAPAFPVAAVLVAWALSHLGIRVLRNRLGTAGFVTACMVTLAAMITVENTSGFSARHRLGDALEQFGKEARPIIAGAPERPVEFYFSGAMPVQAVFHRAQFDLAGLGSQRPGNFNSAGLRQVDLMYVTLMARGECWLIGRTDETNALFDTFFANRFDVELMSSSFPALATESSKRPISFGLYLVTARENVTQ
jgi:4-amino-4-deoxy-L-arabinose transferase-like glycosyltransferase